MNKRKRHGKSNPLISPRVRLRKSKPLTNKYSPEEIYNKISECELNWVFMELREPDNKFIIFYIRKDVVTPTSITGKRIFLPIPPGRTDYGTVEFSDSRIETVLCFEPEENNIAENVVIACISGRGGGVSGPNGMTSLRNTLRTRLATLGVPSNNIFQISWNKNRDSDPFGAPLMSDLKKEINSRNNKPSYIAIIGHSFGGWAASKLSRVTAVKPDFIGLIDPVYGASNIMSPNAVPIGSKVINWYQKNGINGGEPCTGIGSIPCTSPQNGISCGYQNVPGAQNINEVYLKTWSGAIRSVNCLVPKKVVKLKASHIDIDDDEWIHRQIFDQISSDIKNLIKSKKARRK